MQLPVHLYLDRFFTHFSDIADAVDDFTTALLIIVSKHTPMGLEDFSRITAKVLISADTVK